MNKKNTNYRLDDSEIYITALSPVCSFCKNLAAARDRRCKAFDSIPMVIWVGDDKHTSEYQGDNGIRFERKE